MKTTPGGQKIDKKNSIGETRLHQKAQKGDIESVRQLLQQVRRGACIVLIIAITGIGKTPRSRRIFSRPAWHASFTDNLSRGIFVASPANSVCRATMIA